MARDKKRRGGKTNPKEPPHPPRQSGFQAGGAAVNRQREARFRIIGALVRLSIPTSRWPEFVQAFYSDPSQKYHQRVAPSPFRAPAFDRLNQSPQDWKKAADSAWKRHRDRFLQTFPSWVAAGVDEEIVETATRGPGKKPSTVAASRRRGENTSMDRRYAWAANYLLGVPLKQIAGNDEDVSTVGRVARDIIRSAGWPTKPRTNPNAHAARIYEAFPKVKYHRTKPQRIVQDAQEEAALGDDWTGMPGGKK